MTRCALQRTKRFVVQSVRGATRSANLHLRFYIINSADCDKPRDAFRGESRLPNVVTFNMLGMVPCLFSAPVERVSPWISKKNILVEES